MSNLLEKIHAELCPEIPITSPEFTLKLLEEVTRLRNEIEDRSRLDYLNIDLKAQDDHHKPTKIFRKKLQGLTKQYDKLKDKEIAKKTNTSLQKTRMFLKHLEMEGAVEKVSEIVYRIKKESG